ncbi:MAG: acetate kinase [Nocardioides sp.]|uniref:acetate kinase n=1 Tax=Nocardioides sp. TaxID=35761 RepID=UPI0039E4B44B
MSAEPGHGLAVLALNTGSSSLKALLRDGAHRDGGGHALRAEAERLGDPAGLLRVDGEERPFTGDARTAVRAVAAAVARRGRAPDAVAHRIVHGGAKHLDHAVIDEGLLADLRAAVPLAPLHLPAALEVVEEARAVWPEAQHVACFDTAFFRGLPEYAVRLPVAAELAALGVRRYGFHGLSVSSALRRLPRPMNTVVAHLGSGCSVAAVDAELRPLHSSMSMTPTAGMISGTRSGDLDPEVPLYLLEHGGYSGEELRLLFNRSSGLAGIANGRHDLRDLLAADDHDAALAVEMFVHSAAMAIAAAATMLARWDRLVFTGGIGEHDTTTRDRIVERLHLTPPTTVQVVAADEEGEMDRIARALLGAR